MSATDDEHSAPDEPEESPDAGSERAGAPKKRSRGRQLALRYGPIAVVAVVAVAVIAVLGGGDDGGDDGADGTVPDPDSFDYEDLVASGPLTPIKADHLGEDFEPGPTCDPRTGRIELPTIYAPPCVEAFDGDNGGATATGVSGESIKIVIYVPDPSIDPIGAMLLSGAGADIDPEAAEETMADYGDIFNAVYETYGRRVEVEFFTGTGAADDADRARADAIDIADREPFAVIGGPYQASLPFADELAERDIISFPPQPLPESFLKDRFPLVWGVTTPNQASQLAAEAIANLAGPGPAEMAGDPDLQDEERVYAVVHYDTPDGDHQEAVDELQEGLEDRGIELADVRSYVLDISRLQEQMRTITASLKNQGVTTIIYYGDMVTPQSLTDEATKQDFFPEWILGPNLLADTALFARTYDQEQWSNGFGMAFAKTASSRKLVTAYKIYDWAFGEEPPSNVYASLEPSMRYLFDGIHMAGPELTVDSFRDGLFRMPPSGGGATRALSSRGSHGIWDELDLGSLDNVSIMWWDPDAEGFEDESGNEASGMYRFANGGRRYTTGNLPSSAEEARLFDIEGSVIEYDELPDTDSAPDDYEPPDL